MSVGVHDPTVGGLEIWRFSTFSLGLDHKVKNPLSRVIKLRCVPKKKFSAKKKPRQAPKTDQNGPK